MAGGVGVFAGPGGGLNDINSISSPYGLTGQFSPEAALREQQINRRQQIANMLLRNAMQSPQGQMAGRFYAPPSWTQGLSQMVQAGLGAGLTAKNSGDMRDVAQEDSNMLAQAVKGYQQKTAPQQVEAAGPGVPMANPQLNPDNNPESAQAFTQAMQGQIPSYVEGPRPTAEVERSPQEKQQALIELLSSQHPQAQRIAQMLAQQEQQKQQQEMARQQAILMENLKTQNDIKLKGTQSADNAANITSNEKIAGGKQADQIGILGPDGKPMANEPVVDAKKEIAAAGRAQTNVNVNSGVPLNTELQKEFGKKLMDRHDTLRNVPVALDNLEKAKALIPQARGFMGTGGEPMLEAAKFLNNRMGFSIDTEGVKSTEELRTRIFGNILDNLKKLDASPSTQQQQVMQESLGKIGTDPNALGNVLDAFADQLRGKVDLFNQDLDNLKDIKLPFDAHIKLPEKVMSSGAVAPFNDPEKERRYQEWKKQHK